MVGRATFISACRSSPPSAFSSVTPSKMDWSGSAILNSASPSILVRSCTEPPIRAWSKSQRAPKVALAVTTGPSKKLDVPSHSGASGCEQTA